MTSSVPKIIFKSGCSSLSSQFASEFQGAPYVEGVCLASSDNPSPYYAYALCPWRFLPESLPMLRISSVLELTYKKRIVQFKLTGSCDWDKIPHELQFLQTSDESIPLHKKSLSLTSSYFEASYR